MVNIKKACSSFIKIEFLKAKINYSSAFFYVKMCKKRVIIHLVKLYFTCQISAQKAFLISLNYIFDDFFDDIHPVFSRIDFEYLERIHNCVADIN